MAYRTVEESSLTGIADAIREAGGTEESLLFPDDFLTAISNMGGTGGVLTVLAPAGHTVTISKDGKTKTKTANAAGVAVFKGLSAGAWTYVITDGIQTSQPKTADVAYETTVTASYFAATIHIIYPAGSVCTVTDETTTLTAPDTSGTWDCVVPNAGTWTVSLDSGFAEQVTISEIGEEHTVDKWYLYDNGDERTDITGGWTSEGIKHTASTPLTSLSPTVTKLSDSMVINEAKGKKSGICYITNKIDLTHIKTLAVTVSNVSNDTGYLIRLRVKSELGTFSGDTQLASVIIETGTEKKTVYLDVSSVSGTMYIVMALTSGDSSQSTITVHELVAM